MRIPSTRERVHTDGHEGAFIVVHVDYDRQTVDLIPVAGIGPALEDIPFGAIRSTTPGTALFSGSRPAGVRSSFR